MKAKKRKIFMRRFSAFLLKIFVTRSELLKYGLFLFRNTVSKKTEESLQAMEITTLQPLD